MKSKSIKGIIAFFLALSCKEQLADPIVISMGINCEPAYYLRLFDIRKEAYPFDWLAAINFAGFLHLLEERFEHFLNPTYLMYRETYIHNARYDIQFYHDFPTKASDQVSKEHENYGVVAPNYVDALPKVQEKFAVRVQRFLQAANGVTPVMFFRTHTRPDEARLLSSTLARLFPMLNFTLVIVHDRPEFAHYWGIPRVISFYSAKKEKSGWMSEEEWRTFFITLGLLSSSYVRPGKTIKYDGPLTDEANA